MITIENINGRKICIGGIGKMFYQDGFPISISYKKLKEKGIELSMFHVADELLKHGWSSKTIYNKLIADFQDEKHDSELNINELKLFLNSEYEQQREMIFNYLFQSKDTAKNWLKNKINEQ